MKRIQRKRTKGWRMPDGCVCVCRPSRLGNPFKVGDSIDSLPFIVVKYMPFDLSETNGFIDHAIAKVAYRIWLQKTHEGQKTLELAREMLKDKEYIACFCGLDQPCHADVLIELLK